MPKLILVKHARPLVQPDLPPERWPLSPEGRRQCVALAERLRPHAPGVIVTSEEAKAAETGRLIAEALGVPFETAPGLHEHDRGNVPQLPTREFISLMALAFKKPGERVLGRETLREAGERFRTALESVLRARGAQNAAVVTHGTVLALYAERAAGAEPYHLWRQMGLPSFLVLEMPGGRLIERVDATG